MTKIVKLAAVGDIALSHNYDDVLTAEDSFFPFEKVCRHFKTHDIVIGNLEGPLCDSGDTYPLKCSLKASPKYLNAIEKAGIGIVSLANNHILDYREDGFFETIENLEKSTLEYFGAGKNINEARRPVIKEIGGIRFGFIGCCDVIIDSPFYAEDKTRGISPFKMELIETDISELKKQADIIIVSIHWGIENWSYPTPLQQKQARKMITLGADLILGHHPHVLQGIEKYDNGYIVYSLGNFLFSDVDWKWTNHEGKEIHSKVTLSHENRKTMVLSATINKNGVESVSCQPCYIRPNGQVELLGKHHKILKELEKLSSDLYRKNYDAFWHRYSKKRKLSERISAILNRLKKIHKLRPHHLKKIIHYVLS